MSESLAVEESSPKAPGIVLEDEASVLKAFILLEFEFEPKPYELDGSSRLTLETMERSSDLTAEAEFVAQGNVRLKEVRGFCAELLEAEEVGGGRIPDKRSKAEGKDGRAAGEGLAGPPSWRLRAKSASNFSCLILSS